MMNSTHERLCTTVGASVVLALSALTLQPAAHATTAPSSPPQAHVGMRVPQTAPQLSDAQLQQAIRTLDRLPADLKNADPRTTPHYQDRLRDAIRAIEGPSPATTYVNWFSCGLALGGAVLQYGVPVGKVIVWLKDGYKIFGGVKGLISAIKSGAAAAEIGDDAAEILGGLLGASDIMHACS